MANSTNIQILIDGPRNAVVKITGILDTSNLALSTFVDLTTLTQGGTAPAPTRVRVDHIDYSIGDQLEVQLFWDATTDVAMLPIAGRGKMSFWNFGGLQDNSGAGRTGNILIQTTGWASGTQVFSVILELVKQAP
jgi:hypothetical protein